MSGESLAARMDLTCSSMICVPGASTSSRAACSSVPQPSSNCSRASLLKRCSSAQTVPRPFTGANISVAAGPDLAEDIL